MIHRAWLAAWLGLACVSVSAAAPRPTQVIVKGSDERLIAELDAADKEAAPMKVKFTLRGKGWALAFAADKLTFEKDGRARVARPRYHTFKTKDGKDSPHLLSAGATEAFLEFDRPVKSHEELMKARLRAIHYGPTTARFGE